MNTHKKNTRLSPPMASIKSAISRFAKDESAAVTIEFVLWVPVFVLILAITVDASVLFLTQANLWSIARDTTRQMSAGIKDDVALANARERMAASWSDETTVELGRDGDVATATFTVAISDVSPFNIVSAFTDGDISVTIQQHLEPF